MYYLLFKCSTLKGNLRMFVELYYELKSYTTDFYENFSNFFLDISEMF